MDPSISLTQALKLIPVPIAVFERVPSIQRYVIRFMNSGMETLLQELNGFEEGANKEEWKNRLTTDLRLLNRFEDSLYTQTPSQFFIRFDESSAEVEINMSPFNESLFTTFTTRLAGHLGPSSPFSTSTDNIIHYSKRRKGEDLNTNYFHLAECIPHLTFTTSSDGNAEFFNKHWQNYTGQSNEESQGNAWMSLIHPKDLDEMFRSWAQSVSTGKPFQHECRLRGREGKYEWFEVRAAPHQDSQGIILKWFGTFTNAEERMLLDREKELIASKLRLVEDRFIKLTESGIMGTFVAEQDGTILETNQNFRSMMGMDGKGTKWQTLLIENSKENLKDWEGKIHPHEKEFKRLDGTIVPVLLASINFNEAQNLFVMFDISTQKKAEKAAIESSKAKASFIANISHEIRTPLNGVCGMTELLSDSVLDPQQLECVQIIRKSSDALLTLINNILDFSKADVGKMLLENTEFDIQSVVEDVIDLLGESANAKGIEILYIVKEIKFYVVGDHGRLRQVLINLVNNAIKFTEKGEVVIDVHIKSEVKGMVEVMFKIKDSGIGIPSEESGKLFRPFVQLDNSMTKAQNGTGLGLTICRQIVELMGGKIGLYPSSSGVGTTFWFTIELEVSEKTFDPPTQFDNVNVLVTVQNEHVRTMISEYLLTWGIKSYEAEEINIALDLVKKASSGERFYLASSLKSHDSFERLGFNRIDVVFACSKNAPYLAEEFLKEKSRYEKTKLVAIGANPLMFHSTNYLVLPKPVRQSKMYNLLIRALTEIREDFSLRPSIMKKLPAILTKEPPTIWRSLLVLVVDDNAINQKVASKQMERLGITRVVVASNGSEAVSIVEKNQKFSLILMDCQMPIMDGLTASREIRQREKFYNWPHIPIIALTANASEDAVRDCSLAGMDDFITKPVKLNQIEQMISKWCKFDSTAKRPSLE